MEISPKQLQIASTSLYYATFAELNQDLAELKGYLSSDETARAERFKTAELTNNWSISRGLLRSVLAERLQITASDVKFLITEHGKPILSDAYNHHFSLSHSNSAVLIGISTTNPIGVDLETIRIIEMPEGVAQQYFSKRESEFISSLNEPQRSKEFLNLWTFKEAYMKAIGTGLTTAPSEIDLDCEQLNEQSIKYFDYTMHRIAIDQSCTAALCTSEN